MSNVFLYAPRDSESYRQVEEYLAKLSFNGQLIVLPPGSCFSSPLCLHLRSNDIVILFAEDDEDIEELLQLHNEYENFRIIFLAKEEEILNNSKIHSLSPRFIESVDSGMGKVKIYIANMFKSV